MIKKITIIMGVFLLIVIFIIILASCTRKKGYSFEYIEQKMVTNAKNRYPVGSDKLPKNDKDIIEVPLSSLIENVQDQTLNNVACEGNVKIINNYNNYLYIPYLKCQDKYETKNLYNELTKQDNIVNSGDGLYNINDEYIYRGENVNNYLSLNGIIYRILRINNDKTIRVLDTTRHSGYVWDDRYNIDKENNTGINNYMYNNINSRIKETIEEIYNDNETFTDSIRSYFVAKPICIGKRSINDSIFNTSIECANTISDYPFTLMEPTELYRATLDPNCNNIESQSCLNYNYLTNYSTWSITADKDTSFKVYKITNMGAILTNASNTGNIYIVTNLNPDLVVESGNGSKEKPYLIKNYNKKS